MKFLNAMLAASALALAACTGAADEDPMADREDSAMMNPESGDSGMAPGDGSGAPPASAESAMPGQAAAGGGDEQTGDQCGASEVGKYVGEEATPDVRAQIAADVGHERIRWIGPDTVVTMDYSPERLNVMLDADDVITGAKCA